jgi:hypothetical protein
LFPARAFAKTVVLGTYGNTYPFAEKNMLKVIKERASRINMKKYRGIIKKEAINYEPYSQEVNLPQAKKTLVFAPNMYYTTKYNIYDSKGQVLYPKGFRFKITRYVHLPYILVVINPTVKKDLEWFEKSRYFGKLGVMFCITKGNYFRLEQKLKIPVFYWMKELQRRFKLKAVPSVIWQEGTTVYVKQYKFKTLSGNSLLFKGEMK